MGFVVVKVALEWISVQVLQFPLLALIPTVLNTHLSSGASGPFEAAVLGGSVSPHYYEFFGLFNHMS